MQTDTVAASTLLNLLGVTLDGVTGQLGLGCSPLSVVGAGGGNACSAQPVCCQNNNVVSVFLSTAIGCKTQDTHGDVYRVV